MTSVIYFWDSKTVNENGFQYNAHIVDQEDMSQEDLEYLEDIGKIQLVGFVGQNDCDTPLYKFLGTEEQFNFYDFNSEGTSSVQYWSGGNSDRLTDNSPKAGGKPFNSVSDWEKNSKIPLLDLNGAISEAVAQQAGYPIEYNEEYNEYLNPTDACQPGVAAVSTQDSAPTGGNQEGEYATQLASQGAVFKPFG